MKTTTIIFLTTLAVLMFYSSVNAKDVSFDNDSDEEMTQEEARMLLRSTPDEEEHDSSASERSVKPTCVRCRLGLFKCCSPNICLKRHIRPNKCLKVKA
jgi:hypothetical protein